MKIEKPKEHKKYNREVIVKKTQEFKEKLYGESDINDGTVVQSGRVEDES